MGEIFVALVSKLIVAILSLLPTDVIYLALFSLSFDETFQNIIGFMNYFLPIHWCATLFNAWLGCLLLLFIIKFVVKNIDKFID